MKCSKCGSDIDGSAPICMNCGAAISDSNLSRETKERLYNSTNNETPYPSSNNTSSVKAFGALLIIVGIGADVISMFMIGSGGFGGITIFGTIAFLVGLVLYSNG